MNYLQMLGGGMWEMYCPACGGPYSNPIAAHWKDATEEDYGDEAADMRAIANFYLTNGNKQLFSWLDSIVALPATGNPVFGTYDAYGRLEGQGGKVLVAGLDPLVDGNAPPSLHVNCWKALGQPTSQQVNAHLKENHDLDKYHGQFFEGPKPKDLWMLYDPLNPKGSRNKTRITKFNKKVHDMAKAHKAAVPKKGGCVKQTAKKYLTRKSPSYPANDPECRGEIFPGNDGELYISKAAANGVWRWTKYKASPALAAAMATVKSTKAIVAKPLPKPNVKTVAAKKVKVKAAPASSGTGQCICYKSLKELNTRCPNKAKPGSQFCGRHQKCQTGKVNY